MKALSYNRYTVLSVLLLPVLSLFFLSCSAPLSPEPFSESLPSGKTQLATVKSHKKGGEYISITGIDGVEVPSSEVYHFSPGLRRIQMKAKYKGIEIDKMFYTVRLKPGKSYYLDSNDPGFKVERTETGGTFYSIRDFKPLLMDGETGEQLYPKVKKN